MKPNLKRAALIAIAVLILLGLAQMALAQSQRAPKEEVEKLLTDRSAPRADVRGTMGNGAGMVVWSNRDTGTWTAVVYTDAGQACIIAVQQHLPLLSQKADGCAYPQDWTIAALPPPLDEWAGAIIIAIFGVQAVTRFRR